MAIGRESYNINRGAVARQGLRNEERARRKQERAFARSQERAAAANQAQARRAQLQVMRDAVGDQSIGYATMRDPDRGPANVLAYQRDEMGNITGARTEMPEFAAGVRGVPQSGVAQENLDRFAVRRDMAPQMAEVRQSDPMFRLAREAEIAGRNVQQQQDFNIAREQAAAEQALLLGQAEAAQGQGEYYREAADPAMITAQAQADTEAATRDAAVRMANAGAAAAEAEADEAYRRAALITDAMEMGNENQELVNEQLGLQNDLATANLRIISQYGGARQAAEIQAILAQAQNARANGDLEAAAQLSRAAAASSQMLAAVAQASAAGQPANMGISSVQGQNFITIGDQPITPVTEDNFKMVAALAIRDPRVRASEDQLRAIGISTGMSEREVDKIVSAAIAGGSSSVSGIPVEDDGDYVEPGFLNAAIDVAIPDTVGGWAARLFPPTSGIQAAYAWNERRKAAQRQERRRPQAFE